MQTGRALGAVTLAILLGCGPAFAAASHFHGDRYAGLAKVSLDQARTVARKARPGVITDQELEKERGGTGLRYSFDVKAADGVYEVGVDARTAAVLENGKEGPNAD